MLINSKRQHVSSESVAQRPDSVKCATSLENSTDASIASVCFSIGESPSTIIAVFDIVQKGGGRGGGGGQIHI